LTSWPNKYTNHWVAAARNSARPVSMMDTAMGVKSQGGPSYSLTLRQMLLLLGLAYCIPTLLLIGYKCSYSFQPVKSFPYWEAENYYA